MIDIEDRYTRLTPDAAYGSLLDMQAALDNHFPARQQEGLQAR